MVKIGIVQTGTYRSNQEGIDSASKILRSLGRKDTKIACLPEQWLKENNISNYDKEFAEFKKIAVDFSMTIIPGAFYESTRNGEVISAPVIGPEGRIIGRQEKIHPFDLEKKLVRPGKEAKIFDTVCKFGVVICYDMVFPNVANTLVKKGAQVLVSPSRIVKRGISPWHLYVQVRALENRIPIFAANVSNYRFGGNSIIVDLVENDNVVTPKITLLRGESAITREFRLSKYSDIREERFSDARRFK